MEFSSPSRNFKFVNISGCALCLQLATWVLFGLGFSSNSRKEGSLKKCDRKKKPFGMSEWGLQAKCVDSLNYAAQNISELQAIYFDFSFLFPTLEQEFLIFFFQIEV